MSTQITTAFVQQYHAEVVHLVQQMDSKLAQNCRQETQHSKSSYFDQIGARTATKLTARHSPTVLVDTPHARRRVTLEDYVDTDGIDDEDKIRILIEPENNYAKAQSMAMKRAKDDAVIAAALGTAYTGEEGGTAVTFPATQQIASGTTGMTLAKMLSTLEKFNSNNVETDEEKHMVLGEKQVTDLLKLTEVNSADFNNVKALTIGKVTSYLGFTIIMSTRLATNASSERRCFSWVKPGLLFSIGKDITVDIGRRRDLNNMLQVQTKGTWGVTRMQEEQIVETPCTES